MTIYLKDYRAPSYQIETVVLVFHLARARTRVESKIHFKGEGPLVLNGEHLKLISINLPKEQYVLTGSTLEIPKPAADFILKSIVEINPEANTSLKGLYTSRDLFVTQCESHGFRRITYYLDRPDVMAKFTVKIIADKTQYPVLLSNGNCIKSRELSDGLHSKTYEDPFKKPCYLFALVAGDLSVNTDKFVTQSGREVDLFLYAESQYIQQTNYALEALKKSMRWDEENYGREYDLDQFMIVAVSDFNSGAMENKGLNLFNIKYILASPDTATDQDYFNVESVVAHEYFHNWTGNRITCRDWFQLSLKEGLTVFRDQEFSRDMNSRSVNRIKDVNMLRNYQFPEDSGPTAHPVQPTEYIAVNNFYTSTVYNKGAEVVRLIHTLSGSDGFRQGMDFYFDEFDGMAVTIEDYASCFRALDPFREQFMQWYREAGTPSLVITVEVDGGQMILRCEQSPHTHVIPIKIAFVKPDGQISPEQILILTDQRKAFVFDDMPPGTRPSLLRDFSAPVKLSTNLSDEDYLFLFEHDDDGFARWEAGQKVAMRSLLGSTNPEVLKIYGKLASDNKLDPKLRAELLLIPSLKEMMQTLDQPIDILKLHQARVNFMRALAKTNQVKFLNTWHESENRDLKNQILQCLLYLDEPDIELLAHQQVLEESNMTNIQAALMGLVWHQKTCVPEILENFYHRFRDIDYVMDKWFIAQALVPSADTVKRISELSKDAVFKPNNPNKVRALYGSFATGNMRSFHASDGEGYNLIAQQILHYDAINSSLSSYLVSAFSQWRRFVEPQQKQQVKILRTLQEKKLSPATQEIIEKSLKS